MTKDNEVAEKGQAGVDWYSHAQPNVPSQARRTLLQISALYFFLFQKEPKMMHDDDEQVAGCFDSRHGILLVFQKQPKSTSTCSFAIKNDWPCHNLKKDEN